MIYVFGYILICLLIFGLLVWEVTRDGDVYVGEAIVMLCASIVPIFNLMVLYSLIREMFDKSKFLNEFVVFKRRNNGK